MAFSRLAPIGALSAVVVGVALLGASLGGIVSVDRELAAAAPATVPAPRSTTPVVHRDDGRARRPQLRILRLVGAQGPQSLVVVVDRPDRDGWGERHRHAGPAV